MDKVDNEVTIKKEVDIVIPTDVVIKSEGGLSFKLVVSETGELTTEQL